MSTDRPDLSVDVVRTQREHTVSFNERTGKASAPSHVEEPLQTSEHRKRVEKPLTADSASQPSQPKVVATGDPANRVKVVEASPATGSEVALPGATFIPVDTVPAFIVAAAAMSDDFISAQALTAAGEALAQVHVHADAGAALPPDASLTAASSAATPGAPVASPGAAHMNRQAVNASHAEVVYPPTGTPAAFLMRSAPPPALATGSHTAQPSGAEIAHPQSATLRGKTEATPAEETEHTVEVMTVAQTEHPETHVREPDPTAGFLKVSLSSAAITRLEGEEARAKALRGQIEQLSTRIEHRRK